MQIPPLVVLLDVDNTLFDNDSFIADLDARLRARFGREGAEQYWNHYGRLREELGYVDVLGSLQAFRRERGEQESDPALLEMSNELLEYPFARHLFPAARDVIEHVKRFGIPVLLSDGDFVFQPHKLRRSGLWAAVDGRVQIPVHKELALSFVMTRFPAAHYVAIDDKVNLLAAMKQVLGPRLTTIYVKQGHYAAQALGRPVDPAPELAIGAIGELLRLDLGALCPSPPESRVGESTPGRHDPSYP